MHNLGIPMTDKLVVWSACELQEHSTGYVALAKGLAKEIYCFL